MFFRSITRSSNIIVIIGMLLNKKKNVFLGESNRDGGEEGEREKESYTFFLNCLDYFIAKIQSMAF